MLLLILQPLHSTCKRENKSPSFLTRKSGLNSAGSPHDLTLPEMVLVVLFMLVLVDLLHGLNIPLHLLVAPHSAPPLVPFARFVAKRATKPAFIGWITPIKAVILHLN